MEEKPSVLFFSCSETVHPSESIKLVMENSGVSSLPDYMQVDEDIKAYPWHIENKYYSTDVYLCAVDRKTISSKNFADTVQAVVLYFDSTDDKALDTVESWLPFVNEFDPDIKILLCKTCIEEGSGCNKRSVLEWCIGKGFELIELEPEIDEDDIDDDFPETTGVKRIVQALNAHIWPNLVLKGLEKKPKEAEGNLDKSLQDFASGNTSVSNDFQIEESLEELLENDDDFSELFSQLPEMKARVSVLSGSDRKAAAEQVVLAFWKAMGGDEDEFQDI